MPFEMDSTISIHAPREGGDCSHTYQQEATQISIHAPCEGGDVGGIRSVRLCGDFNPRPPRGGRLFRYALADSRRLFQSTPPARGAT